MKTFERKLSLSYAVAIAIGGMLGSGLFVLPGIAAANTGPSIWLAYLLAAICVFPAAVSKAEMATAMPTSGGTYVYIERSFGPLFGTISGIGLWLSLLLKSAFALVGFGAYLLILVQLEIKVAALILLGIIMLLNISGVKKVGKVQLIIITISLAALIVLTTFGTVSFDVDLLRPSLTTGSYGLFTATAIVFVSFAGIIKVVAIAEEIKNPNRNLPAAMILTLLIITVIYVAVTFVMMANVPASDMANDLHPIYSFARSVGGEIVGIAAAVIGMLTLFSGANSGVLAASRFPFAMSRDQLLPEFFAHIHSRFLTPVVTIVVTCLIMALAVILLDVEKIAKLASAFMVLMFISVNVCVIVLRETSVQWYKPSYKSPFYPFIQVFGTISGIVLLAYLGLLSLLAIMAIAVLGYVAFYFYGKSRAQRRGVLRLYGHRPALSLLYQRDRGLTESSTIETVTREGLRSRKLEKLISKEPSLVVVLFGKEYSPEMIVEMGLALSGGKKVHVVHITEVPEQTMLDAFDRDDKAIQSLERRIKALSEQRSANIQFDAVATHEVVDTIHTISNLTNCKWMVMGWEGRASDGLLVKHPIGWLTTHLNSHFALFKDNGVRYIRRVLVCLRPGREDAIFLRMTDQIANFHNAEFKFMRVVPESTTSELREELLRTSGELLENARSPYKVEIAVSDKPVDKILERAAGYDLLITGTPEEDNILKTLFGTGRDQFADSAPCSVIRLTVKSGIKTI